MSGTAAITLGSGSSDTLLTAQAHASKRPLHLSTPPPLHPATCFEEMKTRRELCARD